MVSMSASIDGAASAAFQAALGELSKSLGKNASLAPRKAALQMCTNFAAATPVAKEGKEISFSVSDQPPRWITYKDGRKLDRPLRRYKVTLKSRGLTFDRYVYASSPAEAEREIRRVVGTNYFAPGIKGRWGSKGPIKKGGTRGLAKRSWGWVKHNIYAGKQPDEVWQRRKNDRRDPKSATSESCSTVRDTVTEVGGMARICNRVDYVADILTRSIDEVVQKATSAIIKTLVTKRIRSMGTGATAKEIRQMADAAKMEFMKQFPD